MITSGRYITNGEESNGSEVAIVNGTSAEEWNECSEKFRNADGTISLFGKKYQVVGTYHAGTSAPIVPFLTVPDDVVINQVGFSFERNITRSIYNDITDKADEYLPGVLIFPDLQFPDTDTVNLYNNMIWISVLISVLSVINFAMLYHFILQKRQRSLAIMRICGCTKFNAVILYFAECTAITLPSYIIGTGINIILTKKVMKNVFEFFEKAYSFKIYALLFAAYAVVYIIILLVMIYSTIRKSIIEEWRE
jgi:ABC-type antimicrobial peptide transport system permease subunit